MTLMISRDTEMVPAGPFSKWIEDRVAFHARGDEKGRQTAAVAKVAEELGWTRDARDSGVRRLYRYRYGLSETRRGKKKGQGGAYMTVPRPMYERYMVEDALNHAGGPVLFEEVYPPERFPALYEDIPLEPEAWCANCQETCSPIRGVCPWCDGGIVVRAA